MIVLSRLALLLASSLLVASCRGQTCTTQGCDNGLTVDLTGGRDGGIAFTPFQIDFAKLVDQQVIPLGTCTFSYEDAVDHLVCDHENRYPGFGLGVTFKDTDIRMLRVTYSANGAQLSQETVSPVYKSEEVWGEGCGYCTRARVQVPLPPP